MIHPFQQPTRVPWYVANPGFADQAPPEPVLEPTQRLKALAGRIYEWELQRRVKQLLVLLAALARFQSWAIGEIRRWLHAAPAVTQVPAFDRVGRVCALSGAHRVRGPPMVD